MTWLIISELFPSSIRGRALGFATIVTYLAAGMVSRTFLSLQEAVGLATCFAFYLMATFVSVAFAWVGVPDTGGEKTPEGISAELDSMRIWRQKTSAARRPWPALRGYGSYGGDLEVPANLDVPPTSAAIVPPLATVSSGLTPRRSSSNNPKEII